MGGLLAGLQLGRIRPAPQLQGETRESIRTGIGLIATMTAPVLVVLVLCAISVASAVFLVLELEGPFEGPVRVSGDPLVAVLGHMNR